MNGDQETLVFDASAAVKWFRPESGSDVARGLLRAHSLGDASISVAAHTVTEVLSVANRENGTRALVELWERLGDSGIDVVPMTDDVVREAASQCDALGCSFYDALAPAVARLLGATLVSADARAHGAYAGVRLIG